MTNKKNRDYNLLDQIYSFTSNRTKKMFFYILEYNVCLIYTSFKCVLDMLHRCDMILAPRHRHNTDF